MYLRILKVLLYKLERDTDRDRDRERPRKGGGGDGVRADFTEQL